MYYSDYNRPQLPEEDPMVIPQEDLLSPLPPVRRRKKKRTWPKVLALVLVCALVGGGAGVAGALLTRQAAPAQQPAQPNETVVYEGEGTPAVVNLHKVGTGQVLTAAEVYASNVDSVVGIVTQITTNVYGQQVAAAAAGSGFVLTQDGYIITNHHVIEQATSIQVKFHNGDSYDARLVGAEEENDLAVLKINAKGLTPVRLGTSDDLVVGEDVVAIGNPLGELTFTMTNGIVSALDRVITMSDGTAINVLQTNCAINSGNSGGPLFNMYGQVIGITNAKYSNNGSTDAAIEGIGFAIPMDDVKEMIYDIMEHGYVTGKPYVGVTLSTANAEQAARYGRAGGAYVQSVVAGAAADKAGLKKGDIITAVDGEEIDGHAQFIEIKNRHKAGDTVELSVDREGKMITLSLTFDEQTPSDQVGSVPGSQGNSNPFGGSGNGYDDYDDYFDYFDYFNPFSGFNFGW